MRERREGRKQGERREGEERAGREGGGIGLTSSKTGLDLGDGENAFSTQRYALQRGAWWVWIPDPSAVTRMRGAQGVGQVRTACRCTQGPGSGGRAGCSGSVPTCQRGKARHQVFTVGGAAAHPAAQ